MENEVKTWLSDIKQAIIEISSFVVEIKDFSEFKKDIKTKRAVERNIEIIGEAIHRILREHPLIEIKNARKIVDTRNRIIHGYDTISSDILWSIVNIDIPNLSAEVERLLLLD